MKVLFKNLCVALIATSLLVFASCSKDDDNSNSGNQTTTDENNIDLFKVNIADNYFYLTKTFCEDFSAEINSWLLGGISNGTLYYDLHYSDNQVANNYRGAEFNFIINGVCKQDMYVEEYNPETQYLELSTDEDIYSGTVTLTQDADKVYMKWTGASYRDGQSAIFEGWQLKTKIK